MTVTIVIDTNALWADPALRGASIGRLLAMSRRNLIDLVIPQVVLDELHRHRRTTVMNEVNKLEAMPAKAAAALKELGVTAATLQFTPPAVQPINMHTLMTTYDEEVARQLTDHSVITAPLPDEPVANLYARDLAGRKPFDAQGKGFRDALIWVSVVQLCKQHQPDDTVYFVTNDQNFGNGGIDTELLAEIPTDAATLAHAKNVDDLLLLAELSERTLTIRQIVESLDNAPTQNAASSAERGVRSAITELLNNPVDDNEHLQLDIPEEIYDVTIIGIDDLREYSWNAYDEFDGTTVLGQATITVDLQLEGTCDEDDLPELEWYTDDQFTVTPDDRSTYTVRLTRPAVLFYDVRVELSSNSAEQVDFEGLQPG